ncbi:hypothetical protein D3C72_2265130 [compost metagenome]
MVLTILYRSHSPLDSAGVFTCTRYMSWTMRPSSRIWPPLANMSLTGVAAILARTVVVSSLPVALTAFR